MSILYIYVLWGLMAPLIFTYWCITVHTCFVQLTVHRDYQSGRRSGDPANHHALDRCSIVTCTSRKDEHVWTVRREDAHTLHVKEVHDSRLGTRKREWWLPRQRHKPVQERSVRPALESEIGSWRARARYTPRCRDEGLRIAK